MLQLFSPSNPKIVNEGGRNMAFIDPSKLFQPSLGTPILEGIEQKLNVSNFSSAQVEVMNSIEYIKSPVDVIKICCFGQQPTILRSVIEMKLLRFLNRIRWRMVYQLHSHVI